MIINNCFKVRTLILTASLITGLSHVTHVFAQAGPFLPDLIITRLTGPTTIIKPKIAGTIGRGMKIRIPIEVVVKNKGGSPAGFFEIDMEYEPSASRILPARSVVGLSVPTASSSMRLAPLAEATFEGTVEVKAPSHLRNDFISLRAIADGCNGDSPMPRHCRVGESNERNNESRPISIYVCEPGPLPPSKQVQDIPDLGPLPNKRFVTWPTPPSIERDVHIRTLQEFRDLFDNPKIDKSRTRFYFHTNIDHDQVVNVNASDVEIVIMPGFKLHNVVLNSPVHRVTISGCELPDGCEISGRGEVGRIRASIAESISSPIETNEDSGYITDVLIDGITLNNSDGDTLCQSDGHNCDGVTFRGVRRGAVINSTISSLVYPIGAWKPLSNLPIIAQNEDIIIANNRLYSKGYTRDSMDFSEATVRMHDSVRTVTVHNRLQNGDDGSRIRKHNYRIHGFPDKGGAHFAYAACNLFVHSGVMVGEGADEDDDGRPIPEYVSHYWFNSNQFYQLAPSLYQMGRPPLHNVQNVRVRGNRAYSNSHTDFYSPDRLPVGWIIRDNVVELYGDDIRPPD